MNDRPTSARKTFREAPFICATLLWPFLFMFPYSLHLLSVGNDFQWLYYRTKIFYLAGLAAGHAPLWNPMEGLGFPLFSSPFTQAAYPLNALYLLHYVALGGLSLWDYTLYTIAAFSIFGCGLYCWLRRLSVHPGVALAAVFIALMSFRLTELIRFPNAAHSAAWMPWILYGISIASDRSKLLKGSAVVCIASLMLLTAGYPYFIVYAAFLVVPYAVAMLFPTTRDAFLRVQTGDATRPTLLIAGLGTAAVIAMAVAYPWLRQVQSLMAQTVDRTPDFQFATGHSRGLLDIIGSFIFPPAAIQEGWFYFGVLSTLLIMLYLARLVSTDHRLKRERLVVGLILAWGAVIVYFTLKDSALFALVWPHLPVINQMRVWPRIHIIFVPALALLLALSLNHFLHARQEVSARRFMVYGLAFGTFIVISAQWYLIVGNMFDAYWVHVFKANGEIRNRLPWTIVRNFSEAWFPVMTVIAAGILTWFLIRRTARHVTILLVIVSASFVDLFFIANFQWATVRFNFARQTISIATVVRNGFDKPRKMEQGPVEPFTGIQYVTPFDSWGFKRHANVLRRQFDNNGSPLADSDPLEVAALRRLFGADPPGQRIFLTRSIDHHSAAEYMADADAAAQSSAASAHVLFYDGDVLKLSVQTAATVWLTFVDNWDPDWTASVDGRAVPIHLLLGSYKSVQVPPGNSLVEFAYRPPLW